MAGPTWLIAVPARPWLSGPRISLLVAGVVDYQWALNQSGTFPFTRDSTAMALDYLASQIRGCYQGWEWQLGRSYVAGDLWGCAGSWYSGSWHSAAANRYIQRVQADEGQRPWLAAGYRTERPSCSTDYGCVRPG